ncbi:hypothetical protein OIU77_021968 [Salix suchowensis]|uniref:RECEPTOR-LIKE SERINE/THREONINE-PROTEIN KINASE SD1-8 n=2 Tax=Salix TaxID=40685 RepID=A0A9Q0UXS2_9ROSI|nr:hypothetical protein OIU77_021968 [Salix suchowensis]KAJ6738007.1 RECEPTOR-LIKE SERINE/THREONINE-PROTEIN KINASE SD1-8 [Salix koriyanagi]
MFFIFSCILLHLASLTIAQTDLLYKNCPNDVGNYTTNSDFQRNLNSALSSLDSSTQIDYGFYNLSVGQPGPDQANVIALCRGDIGADECQNCIGNSSAKILQDCPKQKEAFGIADTCILRYSNKSIFGAMEDSPISILVNTANATDVNQFDQGLQMLMTRLRSTAASGNSFRKFATGNETAGYDIIFGLVQCTPDLSELQCDNCLAGVIRVIGQLVGRQGARITAPSCNLRYEIRRFFGVTPATPQSPSVSPPPPPGKKKNNARTIIIIVVSTVSVAILISCLCIYLRIKKPKENVETVDEMPTTESLQFDFRDLLSYAWKNWMENTGLSVMDPVLSTGSSSEMMRCIHIGLLCVQENIAHRPNMASVVLMLSSHSLTLPVPSQPAFFMNSSTHRSELSSSMDYNSREAKTEVLPLSVNDASITEISPR